MATPVRESIVAQYVEALKTILVAQGYEIDFGARVYRYLALRGDEFPYLCVITEGEVADPGRPARHYYATLTVHVYAFVRDTETLDTTVNKAVADVKKAILSDLTLRGGHSGTLAAVNWTHFVRDTPGVVDAEGWEEVSVQQVTFETNYIFKHDDPYTGRGSG